MTTQTITYKPPTKTTKLRRALTEVRPLLSLAVPLTIGSASFMLVGLLCSYILGPLGDVPLAAVSLTSSVSVILYR